MPLPPTQPEFRQWICERRAQGETYQHIGESLGVSHVAVIAWLRGTSPPSRTVLLLAAHLIRAGDSDWPLG